MQVVQGKTVLTTLEEMVEASRAAILVVDVQNDFCTPGGVFDRLGFDLTPLREVVPRIATLLDAARGAGLPVVYVMMSTLPDYASWAPAYIRFNLQQLRLPPGTFYTVPETWGWQVVDALRPRPGELIVQKWRSSGFAGTNLGLLLRSRGVESVVVCGTSTYACVESTVRDAMHRDYYPVVAPECVAGYDRELHDCALRLMRSRITVASLADITRHWRRPARAARG